MSTIYNFYFVDGSQLSVSNAFVCNSIIIKHRNEIVRITEEQDAAFIDPQDPSGFTFLKLRDTDRPFEKDLTK